MQPGRCGDLFQLQLARQGVPVRLLTSAEAERHRRSGGPRGAKGSQGFGQKLKRFSKKLFLFADFRVGKPQAYLPPKIG